MKNARRARLLAGSLLPLGAVFALLGSLVGGPLETVLGVMAVGFGVFTLGALRHIPNRTLETMTPTVYSSAVRITALALLFLFIAYLAISFDIVHAEPLVMWPTGPLGAGVILLGSVTGIGFPLLFSRVGRSRTVQSLEPVVISALFVGVLVTAPKTGLLYVVAFLGSRIGSAIYYLTSR